MKKVEVVGGLENSELYIIDSIYKIGSYQRSLNQGNAQENTQSSTACKPATSTAASGNL